MAKKENRAVPPKAAKCTCAHDFQDARYGRGVRLHNPATGKSGEMDALRCTVCGARKG